MEQILGKRVHRQHKFGFKVAFLVAVVWTSIDIAFRTDHATTIGFDISIILMTAVALFVIHRTPQKFAQLIGFIYVMYLVLGSAIMQFVLHQAEFSQFIYNQVIVFTGCGMFFYWKWQWSVLFGVLNGFTTYLAAFLFWEGTFLDYINAGGMLTSTLFVLMIISIELRFQQLKRDTRKTQALQEAEKRNSQLINSANDGVIMIDPLSNIVLFNPAAQRMFGRTEEDTIGKPLKVLIPKKLQEDEDSGVQLFEDANEKDELKGDQQINALHSDGSTFPIQTSFSKLMIDGELHYTAIVRDITDQVHAREQLIQSKKEAEKSKEMQSVFLSNMSHEIRTTMNGVIGLSKLLEETRLDDTQQKYLNAIQNSSKNLLVILNDILDFSKIEAGKMTFENIPFNLRYQVDTAIEVMTVRAQERNLYLKVDYGLELPEELTGDPVRLIQVLNNLIGNGLKFTNRGGVSIRIKSNLTDEKNTLLTFEVTDTGIGIPENKRSEIFSSFTQSSISTTREYGGTGLGLTISKQLVEHMGGRIWVESTYGKGSTFAFEIPFEIAQIQEIIAKNDETKRRSSGRLNAIQGKRVLLIEDNEINQLVASTLLKKWELHVEVANNGLEGVETWKSKDFDLILMDIRMPKMDGYEATKTIRELEKKTSQHVPIIAMTASAMIGDNRKCIEVGMDDYISKPFEPDNLMRKIYRAIKDEPPKAAS